MPKVYHAINIDQTITFLNEKDRSDFFAPMMFDGHNPPRELVENEVIFCDSEITDEQMSTMKVWEQMLADDMKAAGLED